MALEITGRIVKILSAQTGAGKNGNWVKQEFVIETSEQYPKKICCSAWGDKAEALKNYSTGDVVKVSFNLESREYNERWYTDVRAWKIEGATAAASSSGSSSQGRKNTEEGGDPFAEVQGEDDLPF